MYLSFCPFFYSFIWRYGNILFGIIVALLKGMKYFTPITYLFIFIVFISAEGAWAASQFISISDGSNQLLQRTAQLREKAGAFPLLLNEKLNHVADAHCQDMVNRLYFSNTDPDGRDTRLRAIAAGYSLQLPSDQPMTDLNAGLIFEGISGLVLDFPLNPSDALEYLWNDLLKQQPPFADSRFLEVGAVFGVTQLELNGVRLYVYLASLIMARPSIESPYIFQCGHVNKNWANPYYSPIEFVTSPASNMPITKSHDQTLLAITDKNGAYCFSAPRFSSIRYDACNQSFLKTYPVDDTLVFEIDISVECH
jgi:hypothetical protein